MRKNYHHIKQVKKGWTKLPNAIRHDEALTSDAKVIIEELLSVSGNFHISEAGIANSVHLSLERVKKAVKLLKATGYIEVSKVMNNSRLDGYNWTIADANGALRKGGFRETENPTTENPATENPTDGISGGRKIRRSETRQTENPSIYQTTEGFQLTNNQQTNNQLTEGDEQPHHQPDVEEEVFSPVPNKGFSLQESSSEANASPLSGKNSNQPEVLDQREYQFQQFLKKYPKKPTGTDMAATRQAFFEATALDGSFAEIMAALDEWCRSVDWTKEGGRYITKPLNFLTTRKWEELPRTINTEIDPELLKFMNVPTEVIL